jgi:hypothetical protein
VFVEQVCDLSPRNSWMRRLLALQGLVIIGEGVTVSKTELLMFLVCIISGYWSNSALCALFVVFLWTCW